MTIRWYTGQTGAGKSTAAMEWQAAHGGVLLDGDLLREVWPGLGYGFEDRIEQNLRTARLALMLSMDVDVVVATICPYRFLRQRITAYLGDVQWVYVPGGAPVDDTHPYEPPRPEDGYLVLEREQVA